MLRKIRVYGQLAKFLRRRVFEAEVTTAAEAVRFLLANFPHLEQHMAAQHYRVVVGEYDLGAQELHDPAGSQDIQIIPVLAGAGGDGGGLWKVIAGVALIALAIVNPFGAAAIGTLGVGAGAIAVSTAVGIVGVGLALSGTVQLLTPQPKAATGLGMGGSGANSETDPRKSYSFSGVQQTSRQGVPVPIVYGETLVGSVVISAGIDTIQVAG